MKYLQKQASHWQTKGPYWNGKIGGIILELNPKLWKTGVLPQFSDKCSDFALTAHQKSKIPPERAVEVLWQTVFTHLNSTVGKIDGICDWKIIFICCRSLYDNPAVRH